MSQFYVYLHCRPNGDPFYVGKGTNGRSHEFKSGRNRHHRNIVNKYGRENIEVYVFPRVTEEEAVADEILWIKRLREYGIRLANIADGGDGPTGYKPTPEQRARLSESRKGNRNAVGNKNCVGRVLSDDTKRKISIALKGRTPWLGRRHTEETKEKIAAAHRGRKYGTRSKETRQQMSRSAIAAHARRRVEREHN